MFPVAHCDVGGLAIRIGISSENEHYRAETYATKEPETLAWIRGDLRDGDVFFDVGANVGLYSIFAAKLRPACLVYAFEPESHNFSSLCRNLLLNGLTNVIPCSFPLSDREGFELFHVYDLRPGSALHSLGAPSDLRSAAPAVVRQGMVGVTLDALVGRHGLPAPALLKLDVDGIEEKILQGATALLQSGKLRSLLVEVTFRDGAGDSWAERMLGRHGYQLVGKSDWTVEIDGLKSRNFLFRR
jgi:FkbM family methyltransferase